MIYRCRRPKRSTKRSYIFINRDKYKVFPKGCRIILIYTLISTYFLTIIYSSNEQYINIMTVLLLSAASCPSYINYNIIYKCVVQGYYNYNKSQNA